MKKVEEKKHKSHEHALVDRKKKRQVVRPKFLHADVKLRSEQLTSA